MNSKVVEYKEKREDKEKGMSRISKEVLKLSESPLYKYRIENKYFPVIGEGSLDANIMFVGEAPGKTEAETSKPFCGRSGKLLDELLASVSLQRADVYITSVVKDRPQDNRDPTQEEVELYGPFLDRQFEIIRPKVIVLLGRISMKYVFTQGKVAKQLLSISDIHGQVVNATFSWGDAVLLPLYHPAYALYNGSKKQILLEDFKKLKQFI